MVAGIEVEARETMKRASSFIIEAQTTYGPTGLFGGNDARSRGGGMA
jgi:hypothetical protein